MCSVNAVNSASSPRDGTQSEVVMSVSDVMIRMRVQVNASAGVAAWRRPLQWGAGLRREAAGGGCITLLRSAGGGVSPGVAGCPSAGARGTSPACRWCAGGRASRAARSPSSAGTTAGISSAGSCVVWPRLAAGWSPSRRPTRAGAGERSRRLRPSRRAALSPLPPLPAPRVSPAPPAPSRTPVSSTHYAASVSSYISRIYFTKAHAATSCEGRA